jgi:ABC-type microcin C transport system permease subunit YejB
MIIFTHVVFALLGLAQASYGMLFPSRGKVRATYLLTLATFASGIYLVWSTHAPLLEACLSGMAYLTLILAATFATRYRLAHVRVRVDE